MARGPAARVAGPAGSRRARPARARAGAAPPGGRGARVLPGARIPAGRGGLRRCALGPGGRLSAAVARALARVGSGGIAGAAGRRGACRLSRSPLPPGRTDRGSRGRGARPNARSSRGDGPARGGGGRRGLPQLRRARGNVGASRAPPDDRVRGRIPAAPRGARGPRIGPGGSRGTPGADLPGGRVRARRGIVPPARVSSGRRRGSLPAPARSRGARCVVGSRRLDRRRPRDVGPALAPCARHGGAIASGRDRAAPSCRGLPRRATPTNGGGRSSCRAEACRRRCDSTSG